MVEKFTQNGIVTPENLMLNDDCLEEAEFICANKFNNKIIYETDSVFHDVSVADNETGRFLHYGISVQAGIINSTNYKGNIPYLNYFLLSYLLKKNAKKVLVIGFGIGLLVKQLESIFDKIEKIDAVDIEENIMHIATKYFGFKPSKIFNFYLQDALVFLRENKTKYDIIIADIAGNEGIDSRFFSDEFFINIKNSLKKNGVFAFNSCANTDFNEDKKSFFGFTVKKYMQYFKNFAVFNGNTSNKTYYTSVLGIDEKLVSSIDITNAIFFATDKKITADNFIVSQDACKKCKNIGVDILPYLNDLHKIYL